MEGGKDRMNPVIIGLELEICRNRDAYIYTYLYVSLLCPQKGLKMITPQ